MQRKLLALWNPPMKIFCVCHWHNHSVSDWSGDGSTSDHSNRSWTNVARPWFLLRIDPGSEKLWITSLSAVMQWASCGTMLKALFLLARCSVTEILLSLSPSVCSWSMLGHGSSSAVFLQPRPDKGVVLHKFRPIGVIKLWFGLSSILRSMGSHCWDQVRPCRNSRLFDRP